MSIKKPKIILIIFMLALIIKDVAATEKFSVSTGATYITGDYGNSETTEIYFVPFTFKYKIDKFKFKVTVPYLEKTGPSNVLINIGQLGQRISTKRTTESGLGDISAAIAYNFYYNQALNVFMNIEGKINFGTADASKGLGTGKTDYSARLGLFKIIGKLTPFAKVGYKVYGSSRLHDVFFASGGLNYEIIPEIAAGFSYSWREKVSDSGQERHQLTAFSSQKLTKKWGLQEYIIKGFSHSTADWGGGISISYALF